MIHLRHIPMDGLENARDLGGYATSGGGATRYGVFLRSELPENLSEADFQRLREYNVVRSVDLRGAAETEREPSDLSRMPGVEYMCLPLFDINAAAGSASEKKRELPKGFKLPDWNVTYIKMLEEHKEWPKRLMQAMAEPDGCVHFNCFTGKDRTGLCAAMLLSIAGVSREDICADYSLSMGYLNRRYAAMVSRFADFAVVEADGRPALSGGFFATLPTYMRKTLEHLDEAYGGMIGYLRACGVEEATMARIREKLVEY